MGRYSDLLNFIPRGQFYQNEGYVLPFLTRPHEFLYQDTPNTRFGVFLDNAFVNTLTSDAQGDVIVRLELAPGRHVIQLENNVNGRRFTSYVNIQDYATWYAAYASQLEGVIDTNVEDVEKGVRLRDATSTHIEDTFGRQLNQPNVLGYITDTYRTVLQALRQAYRIFGGRVTGVFKTIAAYTNCVPFIVPDRWRPRWFLGAQLAPDTDFDDRASSISELSNLNSRPFTFVAGGLPDNVLVYTSFTNPPTPQRLRLTFASWGGGTTVDITGIGVSGTSQTETVATVATGVVNTTLAYVSVTRIEHSAAGSGAGTLDVGLAEDRFLRLVRTEGAPPSTFDLSLVRDAGVDYITTGTTFNTNALQIDGLSKGRFSIDFRPGTRRIAALNPGDYIIGEADRLYLNISNRRDVEVVLTQGTRTAAQIVAEVNAATNAAINMGQDGAEVESGVGLAGDYVVLTSDNLTLSDGPGFVRLGFGCADAAPGIFGIPRYRSSTTGAVTSGATAIPYTSTDRLSEVQAPFTLRVGRGQVGSGTGTGEIQNAATITAEFTVTGVGSVLQVGDCVKISGATNPGNNGLHEVIDIISANVVLVKQRVSATVFVDETALDYTLWSRGDLVDITSNSAGSLTVSAPGGVPRDLFSGAALELADELPFETPRDARDPEARLIFDIDPSLRPSGTPPITDSVTVVCSDVPDGWVTNATATDVRQEAFLSRTGTVFTAPAGGVTLEASIRNIIPDLIAFPLRISFWVQQHNASAQDFAIDISTDGGATYDTGTAQAVPGTRSPSGNGTGAALDPTLVTRTFTPLRDATGLRVRLRHSGNAGDRVTVERVMVTGQFSTALYLGNNTYVRDDATDFASEPVLYLWSPEQLSTGENEALGLPDGTVTPGQIDEIIPAHATLRRFDISQYDAVTGAPVNVLGVYDEADWINATTTNLDIVPGVPGRLTFARPNVTSRVVDELSPSPIGAALLSQASTFLGPHPQNPDNTARLDANGVPQGITAGPSGVVPFQFTAPNEIDIDSVNLNLSYTLEYDRFIGVETPAIDLGADRGNYIWLVDSYIAQRTQNTLGEREVTQEVAFGANLRATLEIPAKQNLNDAVLVRDNGITRETVPQAALSFIDAQTIEITDSAFDANSVYAFTYVSLFNQFELAPQFRLEVRSAATTGGLSTAAYSEIGVNDPINPSDQFFQLRLTLFGIEDPDEVRIHSLGLKGIQVAGAGANAPGVV